MRKLILFIMVLNSALIFGQNQIYVYKATVSGWIIYKGDTLAISRASGDTLFLTKGATKDTLYTGAAASYWYLKDADTVGTVRNVVVDSSFLMDYGGWYTGYWNQGVGPNDPLDQNYDSLVMMGYTNYNASKAAMIYAGSNASTEYNIRSEVRDATATSSVLQTGNKLEINANEVLIDTLKTADKTYWMALWNNTTKQLEKGGLVAVTDTFKAIITPATLKGSAKPLEYWKADFSSAQMENGTNANVMVLGDSYAAMYGGWIKFMGGSEYGYGGGFEIFADESYVTSQSTRYVSVGVGWTLNYDNADTKNVFARYAESSTAGATIAISSVNFNKFMLNYRQAVGDGTFSVQLGSGGTPVNVNANGAALSAWYTKNYGNVTYGMPSDTIFIKNVSGTTRLYGFNIQYIPYVESYSSAVKKGYVETHIVTNGGSAIYEMYRGKDTTGLHRLVDSLQVSLAILTFLDSSIYKPVECMDTLVQVLQNMRPEMDILIVNPIDQNSHLGAATVTKFDSIATLRGTAYWNSYNTVGSTAKMVASGAQPDNIHLNFSYLGLVWKELNDLLFYPIRQTHRVEAYELRNRSDYMLFQGTQNMAIVSRNPGRMATTAGNTLIGYRDVLFPAPTGTHLTYIGYKSGNANTSGGDNTGIGYNSLVANTTGVHNVAIGQGALGSNVSGGYNIAIGSNALFYPTDKSNNIAIGYQALGNATVTANDNTAIGYLSQRSATSGTNNTSVGRETLTTNATGGSNTCVGNGAGKMMTTSYNSFFGTYAGFNVSSGDYNTSMGALSMQGGGAVTGTLNACYGYGTGYSFNGAANNNTLIGSNAGLLISTGDGNVCLGQYAGGQLTTESNQLYIDNSNTTTPLIKGDFSTDLLTINGDIVYGDTFWDDIIFPATTGLQGVLSKPDFDYTNFGLLFPKDSTERVIVIGQMPHRWKYASAISPHLHHIQTSSTDTALWKMAYRCYDIGDAVPAWTYVSSTKRAFTYVSGSIHQIVEFPDIPMTNLQASCLVEIQFYRTTTTGVAGDILAKQFDIHYETDKPGTDNEYP